MAAFLSRGRWVKTGSGRHNWWPSSLAYTIITLSIWRGVNFNFVNQFYFHDIYHQWSSYMLNCIFVAFRFVFICILSVVIRHHERVILGLSQASLAQLFGEAQTTRVNRLLVLAARPHAGHIRPVTCSITVYCLISKDITFATIWLC